MTELRAKPVSRLQTTTVSERDLEKRKYEEASSSYMSAVWEHFGFSVDYDDNGRKTVNKQRTVDPH